MTHLNVSLANTLWTIFGFIGFGISVRAIRLYVRSLRAARQIDDPRNRDGAIDISGELVVAETNRLIIHFVTVVIGVGSLWVTPVPPNHAIPAYNVYFSVAVLVSIILFNFLTVINTVVAQEAYFRRRGKITFIAQSVRWISRVIGRPKAPSTASE